MSVYSIVKRYSPRPDPELLSTNSTVDFSSIYPILKVVMGLSTYSTVISKGTVLEPIQNTYLQFNSGFFEHISDFESGYGFVNEFNGDFQRYSPRTDPEHLSTNSTVDFLSIYPIFFWNLIPFLFHSAGMQKPVFIYQFNLGIFVHILIFFLKQIYKIKGGGGSEILI